MLKRKPTFIQIQKLKENCSEINKFDADVKHNFTKVLDIEYDSLTKSECKKLLELTEKMIRFGKRNIPMNVSLDEKEIIEALRMVRLSDYGKLVEFVESLIKESR